MHTVRAFKLRVDALERRDVPVASPVVTSTLTAGILTVNATNNSDSISLFQNSTTITVSGGPLPRTFSAFAVRQVVINTYNGNDAVDLTALACPARVLGGQGIDTIRGGRGFDQIYGQLDNDIIDGGLGNDLIVGGQGNDRLSGGFGDDEIFGDDANFASFGGRDIIFGGRGRDWLYGEGGIDNLYANDGTPALLGEFDFAFGGADRDNFYDMPRNGRPGFFRSPLTGRTVGCIGVLDALPFEPVIAN